jgi:hypothetical protein
MEATTSVALKAKRNRAKANKDYAICRNVVAISLLGILIDGRSLRENHFLYSHAQRFAITPIPAYVTVNTAPSAEYVGSTN